MEIHIKTIKMSHTSLVNCIRSSSIERYEKRKYASFAEPSSDLGGEPPGRFRRTRFEKRRNRAQLLNYTCLQTDEKLENFVLNTHTNLRFTYR